MTTQPLELEPKTAQPYPQPRQAENENNKKPTLIFVMTDFEQNTILPALQGFGAQFADSLATQLGRHLHPDFDRSVLYCNPGEITGRALAFIAGIDPEDFGRRIAGCLLKIQAVPHLAACPDCTAKRIATVNPAKCKTCGGARQLVMVIQPEQRLVSEDMIKPKLALVDASGRDLAR